jgi:hypothetical protein
MKCQEIKKILPDYAVDNITESVRQTLVAHLTGCADCTRELELLHRTEFLINAIPLAEPPVGLWDNVVAQLGENKPGRTKPISVGWNPFVWLKLKPITVFASAIIGCLVLGGLWWQHRSIPIQQPIQVKAIDEPVEIYIAQHNAAVLEDPATDKNGAGLLLVTAEEMNGEK